MNDTTAPARLSAILAADVAGYTRLIEEDTDAVVAAWKQARDEAIVPLVSEFGGRIVKFTGDGFLAEFSSAQRAVSCATVLQETLSTNRLDFRMGIGLGDVVDDSQDIHGEGVNIAARIEAIAPTGGLCISGAVFDAVRNRVDVRFRDFGEHALKNVSVPVRVWRWSPNDPAVDESEPAPSKSIELTRPDKPSIAVLPFENMSGDPEQDYFADGLTEDIITALSQFQELFVIARNTAFTYKSAKVSANEVATELGVRFVLEGSVRKSSNRVRISAQLIDGDTGGHIWAERYDGQVRDVFDLQEEVTQQVVGSVAPQINRAELAHADRGTRRFDEAHDIAWRSYARFRHGLATASVPQIEQSIELARQALALNETCIVAYHSLVSAYCMLDLLSWGDDPLGAADRALETAEAAMSVLPQSEAAYRCLGRARLRKGDHERAARDFRRAHELNPNNAQTLFILAVCEATLGDVGGAKRDALLALRLSPKDESAHIAHLSLAMAAFVEQDDAHFVDWAQQAVQGYPVAPIRRALLIAYAAEKGDERLMRTHLDELNRFAPNFIGSLFRGETRIFTKDEHSQLLLSGLRKAGLGT